MAEFMKIVSKSIVDKGLMPICAEYVSKAFSIGHADGMGSMLTIKDFIRISEFPVDNMLIDKFYNNIKYELPLLVTDELLEWMGYVGELNTRRLSFDKFLKSTDKTGSMYKKYTLDEYNKYKIGLRNQFHVAYRLHENDAKTEDIIEKIFPNQTSGNRRMFTVINPELLECIMMMLQTNKGDEIRMGFITMKKLFNTYMSYQNIYEHVSGVMQKNILERLLEESKLARAEADVRHREAMAMAEAQADDIHDKLDEMSNKLDTATPNIIYPPVTRGKSHILVIMGSDEPGKYRASRVQLVSLARSIKAGRLLGYTREVLRIDNAQGVSNTWNRIRTDFAGATFTNSTCELKPGITEAEFVEGIRQIELTRAIV